MKKDECLIFKVYEKTKDGPRFTFHTAFDDPTTPADAPDRESIEVRTIACFDDEQKKAKFFDMFTLTMLQGLGSGYVWPNLTI